jgi:hypothetical protein
MAATLTPTHFDEHAINDGSIYAARIPEPRGGRETAASHGAEAVEAELPAAFPYYIRSQPQSHEIHIEVTLVTHNQARLEALKRWFDPRGGQGYLKASDEAGATRRILCAPVRMEPAGRGDKIWHIVLHASSPVWEADEETYASGAITASGQAVAITNPGNTPAPLTLRLTGTSQKSNANALIHRVRMSVANRSPFALSDPAGEGYAIDLGQDAFDTASLTTAKMTADGDDLLVYRAGELIPRWLDGMDSATTKVWTHIARSLAAGRSVQLAAAMTASSPAAGSTFSVSNPDGTALFGLDEFLIIDSETIHVLKWSATEFLVLERACLGTTAATHNAGATAWRCEVPHLSILYDYAGAAEYDALSLSDRKPLISLADSTNVLHVWNRSFLVPPGARRSMGWQPEFTDEGGSSFIRLWEKKVAAQFTRANSERFSVADNVTHSTGNIDFMVGVWVYMDSIANDMGLFTKWTATGNQREWALWYDQSAGRFTFSVSSNGTAETDRPANNFGAPTAGQWYFVVGWHDATNDVLGIAVAGGGKGLTSDTVSYSSGVFDSTAAVQYGAKDSADHLDGRLDGGFMIKAAPSSFERAWMYNEGRGRRWGDVLATQLEAKVVQWNDFDAPAVNPLVAEKGLNMTNVNTVTEAEGVCPGYALSFEDALPVAGKPQFNNAAREFPVPVAAQPAALEFDLTVENNMLLHGLVTDLDGNETRLITEGPQSAAADQEYTAALPLQKVRLHARIGSIIGVVVSDLSTLGVQTLTITNTRDGARFVLDAVTTITGIIVALRDVASADNINVAIYSDSSDAPGVILAAFPVILNADIPSSMTAMLTSLANPVTLPAGTYWAVVYKAASTGGDVYFGYIAQRQHPRIYARLGAAADQRYSPYLQVLTQTAEPQEDAAVETGDEALIDNIEAALDAALAPLIVPGAEEDMYLHESTVRNVRNYIANSNARSSTTGWSMGGSNTLVRTAEKHLFNPAQGYTARSCFKATHQGNNELGSYAVTLPAAQGGQPAQMGCWVWIPTNYDGAEIRINDNGTFGSATGTQEAAADMTLRDQWQFLSFDLTPNAGDMTGAFHVRGVGAAPTAGRFIYFTGAFVQPGDTLTPFVETDGEEGGEYVEVFKDMGLNKTLTLDGGRRHALDGELGIACASAVVASSPDREWLGGGAPGLNVVRIMEVAPALTMELSLRGAFL